MKKYQVFVQGPDDVEPQVVYVDGTFEDDKNVENYAIYDTIEEAVKRKTSLEKLWPDSTYFINTIEEKDSQMSENKRHKWADVIIAYAEGKEVQWKWENAYTWQNSTTLDGIDSIAVQWRIKPQKLKRWVNIDNDGCSHTFRTKEDADEYASRDRVACIEIEYEEGDGL